MKTDDLINAIVADRQPAPGAASTLTRVLPVAVATTAALMLLAIGLRPDATTAIPATAMKLAVTLSLAIAALVLTPVAAIRPLTGRALALLWIAPLVVTGFAVSDLVTNGSAGALTRMIGTKASHCVVLIPLMSLLPLAALLFGLRRGMPDEPAHAGALAGLAAGGIGASFYALNCMEDSPLFVACWYTIAILIVTAVGTLAGKRLLRW